LIVSPREGASFDGVSLADGPCERHGHEASGKMFAVPAFLARHRNGQPSHGHNQSQIITKSILIAPARQDALCPCARRGKKPACRFKAWTDL
jgi:hypothetical protein